MYNLYMKKLCKHTTGGSKAMYTYNGHIKQRMYTAADQTAKLAKMEDQDGKLQEGKSKKGDVIYDRTHIQTTGTGR